MMNTSRSLLSSLTGLVTRLLERLKPVATDSASTPALERMQPRVLMIVYNPVVDATTGKGLIETMGWQDPQQLAREYIADIQECSDGLVNYQIVQPVKQTLKIPVKADGTQYQIDEYLKVVRNESRPHKPDAVDYRKIVDEFDLLDGVARNDFDEVWLFGGPYFGFRESVMAGPGAFLCNADPILSTDRALRRFVIMGFNYQRGVGEMLEDLGHRAEFILARVLGASAFLGWVYSPDRKPQDVYRPPAGRPNPFERFGSFEQIAPGQANVGLMHFAPNSTCDYEWSNPTPVQSCCDDWLTFPNLPEPPDYRTVTAADWGSEIRAHHKWWLKHLPKAAGSLARVANNWWSYVIDPNLVS